MKKKIGILTYYSSRDNYGQLLQCYALQEYLRKRGCEPYLIQYRPQYKQSNISLIKSLFSLKKIKSFFDGSRKRAIAENNEYEAIRKKAWEEAQRCDFDAFRNTYINIYEDKIYTSIDELRKETPDMDLFVCGSDQVWHDDLDFKNVAGWFLQFGEKDRVSYAASMGREIVDKKEIKILKTYLNSFKAISVREENACNFLHEIGYKNAVTTIDPTLLLKKDDYDFFINKENEDEYILVYVLNIEREDEIDWKSIKKFAEEKKLKIRVVISSGYIPARDIFEGYKRELLSIEEWLSAVYNAKYIITTSFHGTVFSLIMHKKFLSFPLKGSTGANHRIASLLDKVGLLERLTSNFDEKILESDINWENVEYKIESMRRNSIQFIENNIL